MQNKKLNYQVSFYILASIIAISAVFNIFFCLSKGKIEEWDEARRGVAALEMVESGNYVFNTYRGKIDYWSVKPPLGLWLISASYKIFSPSKFSLRLPSAICALLAILIVLQTGAKLYDRDVGLASAAILTTTFPFILEHSARAGEYDAPLALLIALSVFVLINSESAKISSVLLGIIFGAVFLLKSFSVLLALGIYFIWIYTNDKNSIWKIKHILSVSIIASSVIGTWAFCRYQVDGSEFFLKMLSTDLNSRSFQAIEGHNKGIFYYIIRIIKQNIWWSSFAFFLCLLNLRLKAKHSVKLEPVLLAWALIPLLVSTLMKTKLPWYINSLYPGLAIILAIYSVKMFTIRPRLILTTFILTFVIGEIRIIDKIFKNMNLPHEQLLLSSLKEAPHRKIGAHKWSQAGLFITIVEKKIVPVTFANENAFIKAADPGDYLFLEKQLNNNSGKRVNLVGSADNFYLYKILE